MTVRNAPALGRWADDAACIGAELDLFFGEIGSKGDRVETAKQICADCPVIEPCLAYAIDNHINHGIWGGTTDKERRRIRRQRRTT